MAANYGTSKSHGYALHNFGKVKGAVNRQFSNKGSGSKNRKADFKNQAKLMKYGAELEDWQQTRFHGVTDNEELMGGGGHAGAAVRAARAAAEYRDGEGNVLGNINASYRTPSGNSVSIGGWKNSPLPKQEDAAEEYNPIAQGQQMKQFAGPRQMFLGSTIPLIRGNESTADESNPALVNTVGSIRRNPATNKFESMVGDRDAYQEQQDTQAQQNATWHDQQSSDYYAPKE